jgi:hypothetical protein
MGPDMVIPPETPATDLLAEVGELEDERIDQEEARVTDWRFDRLSRLGVKGDDRLDVAASDVDVHDVERLLEMGCPLDLAIRIVR